MTKKAIKRWILIFIIVVGSIALTVFLWSLIRTCSPQPEMEKVTVKQADYTEEQKVQKAIALSYLTYGMSGCDDQNGSINEILERNSLPILDENFGIKRTDENDPSTAIVDVKSFVTAQVGDFRIIEDRSNKNSGFYGVAYCDDEKNCIWISYSGATEFNDYTAVAGIILVPWLSAQERDAFDFFNDVLQRKEVKNRNYKVIFTGHSLGGALATELALVTGCEGVTINGAVGIAYDKITQIYRHEYTNNHVVNYMTSVEGAENSNMTNIQKCMYWGSYDGVDYKIFKQNDFSEDVHNAFSFLLIEDDFYGWFCLPEEYEGNIENNQ